MKSFQHACSGVVACIICVLLVFILPLFFAATTSPVFASSHQEEFLTDSTPSLAVYPSSLNEQNCLMSTKRTWTCVVTLQGYNLTNILVIWSAYTPISGISISPTSGHLLTLIPTARVTISNLPCTNTFFLFSGHVYGGGSVIPTTVAWSCTQQATPTPTSKPTPLPTRQPTPTPTLTIQPTLIPTQQPTPILTSQSSPKPNAPSRTAIPKGTDVPLATPTMLVSPTPILPSVSKEKPPTRGKNSSSTDMFTVVSIIFDVVIALVTLILFAVFMKRRMFKVR